MTKTDLKPTENRMTDFTNLNFSCWMDQDDRLKTNGFMRAKISFTNGYGASVIFGPMIRDFEVAVLKGEYLCYDTPIAEDVIAGLDLTEVTEVLRRIESL